MSKNVPIGLLEAEIQIFKVLARKNLFIFGDRRFGANDDLEMTISIL
jgi:hypothetical protein